MKVYKGKIVDLQGSWLSGMATLVVEDENGQIHEIPCENPTTIRAFEQVYGNIIMDGHTFSIDAIKGKWIYYTLDDMGLMLGGFIPEELASPEIIELYEKSKGE